MITIQKISSKIIDNPAYILATILLFALILLPVLRLTVFAAPPGSEYTPGETLDPTCAPGDANCTVAANAIGETIVNATEGSALFAGASGVLAQDNANFFWDDTNNFLGLGVNSSLGGRLHVRGTGASNATTSLLVQNSTPVELFRIYNN